MTEEIRQNVQSYYGSIARQAISGSAGPGGVTNQITRVVQVAHGAPGRARLPTVLL